MNRKRIWHLVNLHNALFLQNLRARYQETWLGLLWPLVYAILYAGVLVYLFQYVLDIKIRRFSSFVLIGVLNYGWFRSALAQATMCIISNRSLVKRPGFKPEVLPVLAVTNSLLDFLLAIPILALVVVIGGGNLGYPLLSIPLLIFIQFILTVGIAFLLATLTLVFRDTTHLVDIALTLGFFLTPIFYSIEQVPEKFLFIYTLNPLVPLLQSYLEIFNGDSWPDWSTMAILTLIGMGLTVAGWKIFRKYINCYIEEI